MSIKLILFIVITCIVLYYLYYELSEIKQRLLKLLLGDNVSHQIQNNCDDMDVDTSSDYRESDIHIEQFDNKEISKM